MISNSGKTAFFVLCLLAHTTISWAQVMVPPHASGSIFIVRHAEKEKGDNPPLTKEGFGRAGDLMRRLQQENIAAIYTTPLKRTQQTADSLRLYVGVDTFVVAADTACVQLLATLTQQQHWHKKILIVTHSHIVPKLLYKLGFTDFPQQNLPEKEFDNLFIVHLQDGKLSLKQEKYGAVSTPAAPMKME
jgi:broad specificity phosphatase PhoE